MAVDVINANLPIDGGGTGPVTLNFAPQGYLSFPGGAGSPVPTINLTSTTNQTFVTIGYVNQWAAQWAADPNNPLRGESVSFGAVAPLQIVGPNIQLTPGTANGQVLTWSGSAWTAQAGGGGPGDGVTAGAMDALTGASGTDSGFLMRGSAGGWVLGPWENLTDSMGNVLTNDNGQPLVVIQPLQPGQAFTWAEGQWVAAFAHAHVGSEPPAPVKGALWIDTEG